MRRPDGTRFKTVLSIDAGGIRGIFAAVVLAEVEQSIKRYLLRNPHLFPADANITDVDDFDIDLVDYFDCMTGSSTGAWISFLLGSRGGKGAFRAFLDKPEIVEKYGVVRASSAEALRVFYNELSSVIYPADAIDINAGVPFDLSNPAAPGVSAPLFPVEGLQAALETALGDATLDDLDTSVICPTIDLASGRVVFFVRNAFRDPPVSSSAVLFSRDAPRPPTNGGSVLPDLIFNEGANYFLKDVGTAAGTFPVFSRAVEVGRVDSNNTAEFLLADGTGVIESPVVAGTFFVASESGVFDIEKIAVLTIGHGLTTRDFTALANAGALGWVPDFSLATLYFAGGQESSNSLLDYLYYSNPNVRPNQFLRVQRSAPITTEEGMVYAQFTEASLVGFVEQIGLQVAQEFRTSIDTFVNDFIFG